jgi:hypothetical protein
MVNKKYSRRARVAAGGPPAKVQGPSQRAQMAEAKTADEAKAGGEAVEMPTFDSLLGIEADPRVKMLYAQAKKWAAGHTVDAGSVITFVTVLIAALQEIVKEPRSGGYKKKVLMTVLRMVIENDVVFNVPGDRAVIMAIVNSTVPVFIDTAIGIAVGDINLGKLFASCSPCCMGGRIVAVQAVGETPV